jgi:hypothetical protein
MKLYCDGNDMKRIIIFTLLAPPLGVLLLFLPVFIGVYVFANETDSISFLQSLAIFPFFFIFGYYIAIVPAFIIGIVAKFLAFKNPWINYGLLILSSIIICFVYFFDERDDWFSIFVSMGIFTTMILGYFMLLKGKHYSIKILNEELK